jgi:mannose-6-phosphate isomerase-like protein (cupin superfamily)
MLHEEEEMSEYAVKRIDEMEAVYLGAFKRARAELGVEAFGLAVIDLPPDFENYPEHDHANDGQEEVFMALRGGGEIEIEGERFPLDPEHMVRIAAGTKRKIWPGSEGVRMVIVGGVPGAVYEPPDVSKLGEPDPMAR